MEKPVWICSCFFEKKWLSLSKYTVFDWAKTKNNKNNKILETLAGKNQKNNKQQNSRNLGGQKPQKTKNNQKTKPAGLLATDTSQSC